MSIFFFHDELFYKKNEKLYLDHNALNTKIIITCLLPTLKKYLMKNNLGVFYVILY